MMIYVVSMGETVCSVKSSRDDAETFAQEQEKRYGGFSEWKWVSETAWADLMVHRLNGKDTSTKRWRKTSYTVTAVRVND